MVPDKFNMVDMEGIDILFSYGDIIPGLYQKLVESITQCRYQCLYNWYFDGVLLPPTYVEMTINQDTDDVWINGGVFVTSDDRMLLHLPSLETASGSIIYITDALSRKVEGLTCYINPIQTGSGDPSPDNIRPISGWTVVNVYRESSYDTEADPTVTVVLEDVLGTAYGGTLYVISGRMVVDRRYGIFGPQGSGVPFSIVTDPLTAYPNTYVYSNSAIGSAIIPNEANQITRAICTHLPSISRSQAGTGSSRTGIFQYHSGDNNQFRLAFPREEQFSTNEKLNEWFQSQIIAETPFAVCFPLNETIEYQLTQHEMTMLLGNNAIWHDANGDISVTYWKE